jgi:hypothetical protein
MAVQIFSLLMLSNVMTIQALEKEASAMNKLEIESSAASSAASKLEIEAQALESEAKALLQKEWAEPLMTVLKRAEKTSKTMGVSEALKVVGHKVSPEISGFLQGRNTTQEVNLQEVNPHSFAVTEGALMKPSVFDRAMGFINAEIKIVREELDLKLLECGFFQNSEGDVIV